MKGDRIGAERLLAREGKPWPAMKEESFPLAATNHALALAAATDSSRINEALALFDKAAHIYLESAGSACPYIARVLRDEAAVLAANGRQSEATAKIEEAVATEKRSQ